MNHTRQNFVIVVVSSSTSIDAPLEWHGAQAVAMRCAPTAARHLVASPRNQKPYHYDPHECDRHFIQLSDVR